LAQRLFCPAGLIGIKDGSFEFAIFLRGTQQEVVVMPIDSLLVSVAVTAMFVIFAAVLAWGDRQTRPLQQRATESQPRRRSF
jgi:hypothetical protein